MNNNEKTRSLRRYLHKLGMKNSLTAGELVSMEVERAMHDMMKSVNEDLFTSTFAANSAISQLADAMGKSNHNTFQELAKLMGLEDK